MLYTGSDAVQHPYVILLGLVALVLDDVVIHPHGYNVPAIKDCLNRESVHTRLVSYWYHAERYSCLREACCKGQAHTYN